MRQCIFKSGMQRCVIICENEVFADELCKRRVPGKRFARSRIRGFVYEEGDSGCSEGLRGTGSIEEGMWGDWLRRKGSNAIALV